MFLLQYIIFDTKYIYLRVRLTVELGLCSSLYVQYNIGKKKLNNLGRISVYADDTVLAEY